MVLVGLERASRRKKAFSSKKVLMRTRDEEERAVAAGDDEDLPPHCWLLCGAALTRQMQKFILSC
jgi:hypothetical protein